jgi:hypothetical protein
MPTNEALSAIRKSLNTLDKQPKTLFTMFVSVIM